MNGPAGFPSVDWTATFEEDCISAIVAYLAECSAADPQSLVHDGIALHTLAARHLYTLLVSTRQVQMHYASHKAGQECDLPLADPHVRAIMERVTGRRIAAAEAALPPFAGTALAWLLVRWLKHQFRPAPADGGHGRPLLLAAHHPKFVKYFQPLLDAMPETGAFLLPDRPTQKYLGIPDAASLAQPLATPKVMTPAVRSWRGLCLLVEEVAAAIKHHAPRCILVAEGDAPYHEALALVGRRAGIPVLCLQWGAFPYRAPHLGFRNMSHDAFLSWGRGFSEQLRPFNPGLRFIEVGNHMLSAQRTAFGRRILFLMQGADNYTIQQDHWNEFMDFTAWTAGHHPDWQVIVRVHPNLPLAPGELGRLAAFANVSFQDAKDMPMGEALQGAAIAVTIVSSAILEALAQGVFPFLFNPTTMVPRFQPDIEALGAGIEAKTLERAKAEMARLLADPGVLSAYRPALTAVGRDFFSATGPTARDNIVSTIRKALAGDI